MAPSLIPRARLEALLAVPATRGLRIAIVGDAMLDVYLRGDVDRISPEAPVPVVRVQSRVHALGGAANVAQNVAALGARGELVAAVGDDAAGAQLRAMLTALGADAHGLVTTARPTTTKTRVVARGQQVVRVDEEVDGDLVGAEVAALDAAVARAIDAADALVLEDYNKGVLVESVIRSAIARARAKGIPVIVDPKYRNFFAFGGATVFKPNRRELEAALGAAVDVDHPEALPAVLERLAVERLLLTLGESGMALIDPSGATHRIPTTAREVFDVVGAGDTVTAYLAGMLAAGATPLEAAVIANHAAGIQVGKAGAATVSPAEILEVIA
ncbi:MAG: bifunctional ADP-heptose synthase [Gemmatimonadota bacterium]|nr:bifunctional ADP-heptose synthase [Gemmatimonadota bacterium]MDQ8149845.1 bifunctional ADP-heptose synthase [Gemmatimonadota bacterium]MDQ8156719.1 bifunctional ADP-heptose synthase [Gemmatimonadota bacterium]